MAEDVPMGALDAAPDWRDQEAQLGLDLQRQYEARQAAPKSSWYDKLNTIARTPGRILGALTASPASPEADQAAMMPETYVSPLVKNTMDAIGGAVKSGITAPGRALSGEMPMIDPETGHTSEAAIQGAFDTAALAGGGSAAGTLATDAAKAAAPVAVAAHTEPFYSGLERAVAEHPQEKMTGEEWARVLTNKPGVKKEEMQFTGTHDLLKDAKLAPITKDQLLDHLNENRVQIGEVTKGGEEKPWSELPGDRQWELIDRWGVPPSQAEDVYEGLRAKGELSDTRYGSYVLPGGENYREKLLTLPRAKLSAENAGKNFYENFVRRGGGQTWEQLAPETRQHWMNSATEGGFDSDKGFQSSHWEEPNVLLHMRMNDRAVIGEGEDAAKKALHLEELQSDWHQQGRQNGYRPSDYDEMQAKLAALTAEREKLAQTGALVNGAADDPERIAAHQKYEDLTRQIVELYQPPRGVPDAPFKKNWHELGLKRALHEAAEGGYDRLSWTPGEAQAARYDLSKHIDQLYHWKEPDGSIGLSAYDKNGRSVAGLDQDTFSPEKLPDVVGKEMAQKILNGEGDVARDQPAGVKVFKNADLKVGGEGMKGFYDKMIPDYLNKIGKPHGVQVQHGTTNDKFVLKNKYGHTARGGDSLAEAEKSLAGKSGREHEGWRIEKENNPVHYMDIPPSLKQQLLTKGMPLFEDSSAGQGIAAASHLDDPALRRLTVNDILHHDTAPVKANSRNVEEIAADLDTRGQKALKRLGIKSGKIEESSPQADEILARAMASEIREGMHRGGETAADWYRGKVEEAMQTAEEMHPEMKDPNQRMGYKLALAVTSQGEKVRSNVRLADPIYNHFKQTGRFPTNVNARNGPAMNSNFTKLNALLDELGPEGTREFLDKEFTVRDLKQMGYDVGSSENMDTKVQGSQILGSKIGGGFYQNLNGNYNPVTMDLWFMRGWGRLTGTLVGNETAMPKATERLRNAMRAAGMRAPTDPERLSKAADDFVRAHERDFATNRAAYDSGKKQKAETVFAAERYQKNATGINEQPSNGGQRQWIRRVVNRARDILQDHGIDVSNADLQALWWYPEKELYGKLGGRLKSEDVNVDYATALREMRDSRGAGNVGEEGSVGAMDRGPRSTAQANVAGGSQSRGASGQEGARAKVKSRGGR